MDVYERANRARARMMYCGALARGELTDPLSLRRMEEMRQLSERESRQEKVLPKGRQHTPSADRGTRSVPTTLEDSRRRPMTVVELYVRQKSLQAGRSVRDIYQVPFDSSKHPRAEAGRPNGGQFIRIGSSLAGTSADQRDVEFTHEFQTGEPHEIASETSVTEPDFSPPVSHSWKYLPPKEVLIQSRFPNPQHFESVDGNRFLVAFEPKWRYAPNAGLHVPDLDSRDVDSFLDLLERGSALQEVMREKWDEYSEVDNQINDRGWWLPSLPTPEMRSAWNQRKRLLYEYEQLKGLWSQLDAEYRLAGFGQLEVAGYRHGYNDDLRQGSAGGRGLYNAVMAYDQTQLDPLKGGIGVEPTYDEMAIFSAPADALLAMKLGVAALRGSYAVVKEGVRYVLRRELPRRARSLAGEGVVDLGGFVPALHARQPQRLWVRHSHENIRKMAAEDAVEDGALRIYSPLSALVKAAKKAQHHIYTKKRVEEFWDNYKIAVDDHIVDVDDLLHQALHSGQSKAALNNRAGWWDHKLMDKINTAESLLDPGQMLSREDILKIGGEMLEDFRLGHLTPHRYIRRKRRGGKK